MVPANEIQQQPAGPYSFTKVPNEMFGRFKPSTTYVWIALHAHAWKRDGARPSIATVMKQTGLGRTAVKSAIRELVAAKVLAVQKRGDAAPNLYEFPAVTKENFTQFDNGWWTLGLDARQAVVLLAVQHFNTMEFGAVPGCRELARMTKVSGVRVLREVVPELEGIGILEVDRRTSGKQRKSNGYRIIPVADVEWDRLLREYEGVSESDPEVYPYATPRVSESDPRVSLRDPLVYPRATPRVSESDHEEDSYKKIDLQEDSKRKTDTVPPAAEAWPSDEPESFGPGASGSTWPPLVSPGIKGLHAMLKRHGVLDAEEPAADPGTTGTPKASQDLLEPLSAPRPRLTVVPDPEDDPLWEEALVLTKRNFPSVVGNEVKLKRHVEFSYRTLKKEQARKQSMREEFPQFGTGLRERLLAIQ